MSIYKRKKRKIKKPQDTPEQLLFFDELIEVLRKTGLQIRIEAGNFRSGECQLQDQSVFFINKNDPIEQNIDVIISHLKNKNLSNIFVSPKIRSQIGEIELKNEEQR